MGQHSRANVALYQLPSKKPQSPFRQNALKASQIQGSGRTVLGLWDGCETSSFAFLRVHSRLKNP
jgi:hypothetical protein